MQPSNIYYYDDTRRIEYRHVLQDGARIAKQDIAYMEAYGCYDFHIKRYITESGRIIDELRYSIDRDVLERNMSQAEKDAIEQALQRGIDEPPASTETAQLIETIEL